jgi:tripartite-type tricarboxylate transporter receptor subunit TctC
MVFFWLILKTSSYHPSIASLIIVALRRTSKMRERSFLLCPIIGGLLVMAMSQFVLAEPKVEFPAKAIHWIVPYPAGGGFDAVSRSLVPYVRKYLPKDVDIVIENKPGAGGVIGTTLLWGSKPDGYTIGVNNARGLVAADLKGPVQFDLKKFKYIGTISGFTAYLMVGKNTPYRSIKDLQNAKKPIKFGATGVGATTWLDSLRVAERLGLKYQIVTGYRGQPQIMTAIIRGDVDAVIGATALMIEDEHVPIVAFGSEREPNLPDVPTIVESGYPELGRLSVYRVMAAPPGTPDDVLKVLRDAFWRAINEKAYQEWGKSYRESFIHSRNGPDTLKLVENLSEDFVTVRPMVKKALKETQ